MTLIPSLSDPVRQPAPEGTVVYLSGASLPFTARQALSFSLSEGASSAPLLGGAFSASCTLTLDDGDGYFTHLRSPFGAQVHVRLAMGSGNAPLGVYTVTKVARQGNRLTLTGADALGTAFGGLWDDTQTYPRTLAQIARSIASQAGFSLSDVSFPNASFRIPSRPDWGDVSLRQALGYVACACGCFACVDREGNLEFRRVNPAAGPFEIHPENTSLLEKGEEAFGPVQALRITLRDAPRDASPLIVRASGAASGVENTLTLSGNPLFAYQSSFASTLAQRLLSPLEGLVFRRVKAVWQGNPFLRLGDRVRIWDASGASVDSLVTSQCLSFFQGFSMETQCAAPTALSSAGRLFTPSGALNAAMLEGSLNGVMIRDGSIAASSLMAGSITARELASDAILSEKSVRAP